jgi:hypothetical protein
MSLVKEWLLASIDDLKERALAIEPAGLAGLHGEARGYRRLLRTIIEKPHTVD